METVFTNEKELKSKLVNKVQDLNTKLIRRMDEKSIEMGITPHSYIGGISCAICSEGLSLESNINNLIAVYCNNFNESIFFQLDAIRSKISLNLIGQYLSDRGLIEDFLIYRDIKTGSEERKNMNSNQKNEIRS